MDYLKEKNKFFLVGLIVFNLLIIKIVGILFFTKDEKKKEKSDDITNFSFELLNKTFENNTSAFEYKITNMSKKTKYLKEFKVLVKDNYDLLLSVMYGVVDNKIEAGESITTTLSVGEDLSDYNSFEYEIEN